MPIDKVDVYLQFSGGKDKYLRDEETPVATGREDELFGLHDSSVKSWNVGVNYNPSDTICGGCELWLRHLQFVPEVTQRQSAAGSDVD